jgi:hypothetical protein
MAVYRICRKRSKGQMQDPPTFFAAVLKNLERRATGHVAKKGERSKCGVPQNTAYTFYTYIALTTKLLFCTQTVYAFFSRYSRSFERARYRCDKVFFCSTGISAYLSWKSSVNWNQLRGYWHAPECCEAAALTSSRFP